MTKVTFTKKGDFITKVEVKGHACYAPHGYDIVCASISTATQMLISLLQASLGYEISVCVDEKKAHIIIDLSDGDYMIAGAFISVDTYKLLMDEIAKQYPRNLQICTREI